MQISEGAHPTLMRLIRYGISGGIGAGLQVGTLYLWVSVLGFKEYYLVGAILGFIIALICTYLLQRYWTFSDRTHAAMRAQFPIYTTVALANFALTTGLLPIAKIVFQHYGLDFFHVWYLITEAGIVILGAALSFIVNSLWTFKTST
jgi:putative flippase GtrA